MPRDIINLEPFTQEQATAAVQSHFQANPELGTQQGINYRGLFKDPLNLIYYAFEVSVTGSTITDVWGVAVNKNLLPGLVTTFQSVLVLNHTLNSNQRII